MQSKWAIISFLVLASCFFAAGIIVAFIVEESVAQVYIIVLLAIGVLFGGIGGSIAACVDDNCNCTSSTMLLLRESC